MSYQARDRINQIVARLLVRRGRCRHHITGVRACKGRLRDRHNPAEWWVVNGVRFRWVPLPPVTVTAKIDDSLRDARGFLGWAGKEGEE